MMRVLAISGSLRHDSYNTALLHAAAEVAPEGLELVIFDGLREIPPYDQNGDAAGAPPAVLHLRRAIEDADALLFATPEYNGSVPGVLKNAVDWASRPRATTVMQNKPAAVIGASTGMFGAVWAQQDLKRILGLTGNRVLDLELSVGRAQETFVDGVLADHELRVQLREVLEALEDAVRKREAVAAARLAGGLGPERLRRPAPSAAAESGGRSSGDRNGRQGRPGGGVDVGPGLLKAALDRAPLTHEDLELAHVLVASRPASAIMRAPWSRTAAISARRSSM